MLATLMRLMDFPPFRGKLRGPEDEIAVAVANMLRQATLEGRLKATWTCIPHEVGAIPRINKDFLKAQTRYAKAKAMGMITGSADMVFVWQGGGGWIELKAPAGSLSPAQRDFRDWAVATGSNWAVCKSTDQVEKTLIEWGALQPR